MPLNYLHTVLKLNIWAQPGSRSDLGMIRRIWKSQTVSHLFYSISCPQGPELGSVVTPDALPSSWGTCFGLMGGVVFTPAYLLPVNNSMPLWRHSLFSFQFSTLSWVLGFHLSSRSRPASDPPGVRAPQGPLTSPPQHGPQRLREPPTPPGFPPSDPSASCQDLVTSITSPTHSLLLSSSPKSPSNPGPGFS